MKTKKPIAAAAAAFLAFAAISTSAGATDSDIDGQAGIIFASSDWTALYFMGGEDPGNYSDASNVIVTGYGTYTVSVDAKTYDDYAEDDFVTDGTEGFGYAAIEIYNGEKLFPGSVITIDSIKLDGADVAISGTPYTCTNYDNTLVSLYNTWETTPPEDARGVASDASPILFDGASVGEWKNLTVTFTISEPGEVSAGSVTEPVYDTKGSPDTGAADVCVAVGIAILATGAVAVVRKK